MAMNQKETIEQVKADAERLTLKRIREDKEAQKEQNTPEAEIVNTDTKKR